MNIINKSYSLYLTCAFVFVLCCSMSQCKNNAPGPQTTVHGVVKDYKTGDPIANVNLQVHQYSACTFCTAITTDYDTIKTKADGSYTYTFTPIGTGDPNLLVDPSNGYNYNDQTNTQLTLGIDNKIDLLVQKNINLNLHLINNSDQNRKKFYTYLQGCCYFSTYVFINRTYTSQVKIDTSINYKVPEFSTISVISFFKSFNTSKNDTAVTIINP